MDPATSHISPNLMEKIEIVKGPFSFRYGNSFGGTINYISLSPSYSDKKEGYGQVSANYETNGNLFTSEGSAGIKGKVYNISLLGSWGKSGDYKDGDGNKIPSGFEKYTYGINTNFKLSDNQDLKFKLSRSYASDVKYASLGMDMRDDETWMANASHKFNLSKKHLKNWETGMYMTFVDHVMDNLLRKSRKMDMTTKAKTQSHGFRSEGFWAFDHSKLYAGADFKIDAAEGSRYRTMAAGPMAGTVMKDDVWQDASISKTGIFAEYQMHTGYFNIFISGRLEWNKAEIGKGDPGFESLYEHNTGSSQINPNISLGITHNLSGKTSLEFWLGRAQRSGSISERYINHFSVGLDPYEIVGNPDLAPEKNNQADVLFSYQTKNTYLNLDIFGSYLQDYISSVIRPDLKPGMASSPGVRQVININEALKYGFEISWNQNLISGFSHHLNIAYTYGKDLKRKEPLPEIAPLDIRYRLVKSLFNKKMNVEAALREVIKQNRVSSSFGETKTPSFTLLDLKVAYSFTNKLKMNMEVKNLLDEQYYEHLSRPLNTDTSKYISAPGRSFMVSLVLAL
jgi:iron complex outermembrane receptor protein